MAIPSEEQAQEREGFLSRMKNLLKTTRKTNVEEEQIEEEMLEEQVVQPDSALPDRKEYIEDLVVEFQDPERGSILSRMKSLFGTMPSTKSEEAASASSEPQVKETGSPVARRYIEDLRKAVEKSGPAENVSDVPIQDMPVESDAENESVDFPSGNVLEEEVILDSVEYVEDIADDPDAGFVTRIFDIFTPKDAPKTHGKAPSAKRFKQEMQKQQELPPIILPSNLNTPDVKVYMKELKVDGPPRIDRYLEEMTDAVE